MSKLKKKITVRFFSISAISAFFEDFVSGHNANLANAKPVRFFTIRDKKYLIKIHQPVELGGEKAYFLSVVRERITWQAKALIDGTISGVHSNQGLIGDLYYYLVMPNKKAILGFTTGLSASVRSVANAILDQFKKDRSSKIELEPLSRENEYARLKDIAEFTEMRFKLAPALLSGVGDDMPSLFRGLKASPFMASSSKLELTFSEFAKSGFTRDELFEAIDYLADNECCTSLIIKAVDNDGEKMQLDLNKTYLAHTQQIQLRGNFVDEELAKNVILSAANAQMIL